jgi:phosphate transport system substrate-binding protein
MTLARRARCGALLLAVVWMASAGLLTARPAAAAGGSPISGGGSSFAALEIDQWRADTARSPYSLSVNYVSQGSTFGRQAFTNNNLDFGASDITFTPPPTTEIPDLASKRCAGQALANCFVYVPVSAGGVSFMYNLTDSSGNRIADLQLTRDAACKIFTGAIKNWNDPAIVQFNPRLASNSDAIVPVIRADGAGESYVFSDFCRTVDPAVWAAFIADRKAHNPGADGPDFYRGDPVSNWPQGWGRANPVPYGDGVANTVADPQAGKDAITYTAAGYAKVRNFPVASVQNAAGVFTQPDEANVTVALAYATPQNDPASNTVGTFALNYSGADPRAYFPSTYSYIIAQTGGFGVGKGTTLGQFLCYAISKGQEIAVQLRYARLSAPLVQIAINAIVKVPGAPPASACFLAGSAAPPGAASVAAGSAAGAATGATAATGTAASANGNGNRSLSSQLANETDPNAGGDKGGLERSLLTLGVGALVTWGAVAGRRRFGVK